MTGELYDLRYLADSIKYCRQQHGIAYTIGLKVYKETEPSIPITDLGFLCKFCGLSLGSKCSLKVHQKKAIKCLEIQCKGELSKADIKQTYAQFECNACKTRFMTKIEMTRHTNICKSQDDVSTVSSLVSSLTIRNAELETSLLLANQKIELIQGYNKDLLAMKEQNQRSIMIATIFNPTVTNCVIQDLSPLIEEEMREHVQHLTIEHVKAGAEGYAKYALEFPLRDKFICTDVSRRKLAWKDPDGNIIYDTEGSRLAEKFFRILKQRNSRLCQEIITDLDQRCDMACTRKDRTEADAITELTDKICDYRRQVMDTSNGQDTELRNDFIKYLCMASKT